MGPAMRCALPMKQARRAATETSYYAIVDYPKLLTTVSRFKNPEIEA